MKSVNILCADTVFAEMLCIELREAGYNASIGRSSLPDLVILDLDSVADVQGYSVLTFSRDKASDIRRPFDIGEFLKLVSSRLDIEKEPIPTKTQSFFLSTNERYAVYKNERIDLSELEHKLLLLLYNKMGEEVSSEEISRSVFDCEDNPNLVRVYISYLREKIDKRFNTVMIQTVRGKGYRLRKKCYE